MPEDLRTIYGFSNLDPLCVPNAFVATARNSLKIFSGWHRKRRILVGCAAEPPKRNLTSKFWYRIALDSHLVAHSK
jgi:hypothetical protein